MKKNTLLPTTFKTTGWIILFAAIIAGTGIIVFSFEPSWLNVQVLSLFNPEAKNGFSGIISNNITDELVAGLLVIGALLVAFSRERQEDEAIMALRHDCLLWAVLVNYAVLFLAIILVYDLPFAKVLICNMFTTLLLFIARFNYQLYTKVKAA